MRKSSPFSFSSDIVVSIIVADAHGSIPCRCHRVELLRSSCLFMAYHSLLPLRHDVFSVGFPFVQHSDNPSFHAGLYRFDVETMVAHMSACSLSRAQELRYQFCFSASAACSHVILAHGHNVLLVSPISCLSLHPCFPCVPSCSKRVSTCCRSSCCVRR